MKRTAALFLFTVALIGAAQWLKYADGPVPSVFVQTPYDQAIQANASSPGLLVVKATAPWCAPCKEMDAKTFMNPQVAEWLDAHATAIRVDIEHQKDLARELSIKEIPTVIVFKGGKEVSRVAGFRSPDQFLAWLEPIAATP